MPAPLLRLGLFFVSAKFNLGAVGVYTDDKGRVLVLKHVYRKVYPWGFPSGFVNTGETAADGALRELKEETGLSATVHGVGETTLVGPRHLETVVFGKADSSYPLTLCHEIFEARWVDPAQVPDDIKEGLPPEQHTLMMSELP